MRSAATHNLDHLLREAPFVRSLARSLAGQDAEDVVQDSWVRAMECSGNAIREARGWLACVVRGVAHNLRRSQRRRQALENAAASEDEDMVPSPAELMERQELRREMLAAVDALPEPRRTVVLLRHFEGLTPQQISRHLAVPVSTVESRLRTAHASLRLRLDARHGGRQAWLIPLLPVRSARALGGLGVLAMSMQSKILIGIGAMLLAALAIWTTRDPAPPSPHGHDGTISPAPLATSDHDARQPDPADLPRQSRVDVGQPAALAKTGTLIVKAVFGSDDSAIPDLLIKARVVGGDKRFGWHGLRTDAAGLARFENLAPGPIYVANARNSASVRANVVAGKEVAVQLVLPAGVTITGIVVDRLDVPVPGAEVWLAGLGAWEDAERATTTGADGRFELRGCRTECLVGAAGAGHRSSEMQRVMMQDGSVRDLRLVLPAPGGTVVGTVRSFEQMPIVDAIVAIGKAGHYRLDTTTDGALRTMVRTNAEGQFRVVGLPVGEHPVQVRANRHAPWIGACRVEANAETPLVVTLGAAVSCVGVVVDTEGRPVAMATVEVGDGDAFAFEYVCTSTAEDGSFRCDGLPPGTIEIKGRHEVAGTGRADLTGAAGEIVRCTLRLTPGLTLRGRVLREDGEPIADATVDARTDALREELWGRLGRCDAAGRFAIVQCPEGKPLTVEVHAPGFRSSIIEGIDPHRGDLVVRLVPAPARTAFITGTIVTHDGRPAPQAELEAHARAGDSSGLAIADGAGAFTIGPLQRGNWSVCIRVPDQPTIWTEWREIDEGAKCDLGKIWLPMSGTIRVRLHAVEGNEPILAASDATLAHWTGFRGKGSERRSEPLAPGLHYVSVVGNGVATRLLPVEVHAGEEQSIDIEVQRGHEQEFEIVSPAPLDERHVRVLQHGKLIAGESSVGRRPDRSGRYRRNLAAGEYTITVTGNGMTGEASFTVGEGKNGIVRIMLR